MLNQKNKKLCQKGAWPRSRDLLSPNISGTAGDTNLKFCMHIDRKRY